jgi:hypothetical protein
MIALTVTQLVAADGSLEKDKSMAENKTAAAVRDEHIQALGPTLGPLYHTLYNEVIWLHAKWKQYRILFGESPERVELLNSVAGFFFGVIEQVLWEDTILHIARLTDSLQSVGEDNLTLLRLAETVQDPTLAEEVKKLVEQAQSAAVSARIWRNKHLAHRDLALALDPRAEPLPGISRKQMEDALASMRKILNKIEVHYLRSEVAFEEFLAHTDAECLAYYLKVAVDAESQRRQPK